MANPNPTSKRGACNLYLAADLVEAATLLAQIDSRAGSFSKLIERLTKAHLRKNAVKLRTACRAKGLPFPAEIFIK